MRSRGGVALIGMLVIAGLAGCSSTGNPVQVLGSAAKQAGMELALRGLNDQLEQSPFVEKVTNNVSIAGDYTFDVSVEVNLSAVDEASFTLIVQSVKDVLAGSSFSGQRVSVAFKADGSPLLTSDTVALTHNQLETDIGYLFRLRVAYGHPLTLSLQQMPPGSDVYLRTYADMGPESAAAIPWDRLRAVNDLSDARTSWHFRNFDAGGSLPPLAATDFAQQVSIDDVDPDLDRVDFLWQAGHVQIEVSPLSSPPSTQPTPIEATPEWPRRVALVESAIRVGMPVSVLVQFSNAPTPTQVQVGVCSGASIPTPEGEEFMAALGAAGVDFPAGSYGGGCDMTRR